MPTQHLPVRDRSIALASATLGLALAAMSACETAPLVHRYHVVLVARTDTGEPLAGVGFDANGKHLGATGTGGGLALDLEAAEGKLLRIATRCPDGYRTSTAETELHMRGGAGGAPLTMSAECRPRTRRVVVMVRTPHLAGAPVRFRDREVARTDVDGVAHVALEMAPGTRFQLALDTSAWPRLRPRDPTAAFVAGDAEQVFVFDYRPPPPPSRRKRRRRAPPPGPVKIESLGARRVRFQ